MLLCHCIHRRNLILKRKKKKEKEKMAAFVRFCVFVNFWHFLSSFCIKLYSINKKSSDFDLNHFNDYLID